LVPQKLSIRVEIQLPLKKLLAVSDERDNEAAMKEDKKFETRKINASGTTGP